MRGPCIFLVAWLPRGRSAKASSLFAIEERRGAKSLFVDIAMSYEAVCNDGPKNESLFVDILMSDELTVCASDWRRTWLHFAARCWSVMQMHGDHVVIPLH